MAKTLDLVASECSWDGEMTVAQAIDSKLSWPWDFPRDDAPGLLLEEWAELGFSGRIMIAGRLLDVGDDGRIDGHPVIYADEVFQLWTSNGEASLSREKLWSILRALIVFDGRIEMSGKVKMAVFGKPPGRRGKNALKGLWKGWDDWFREAWLLRYKWARKVVDSHPQAERWAANYATDRMRSAGHTIQ